MAAAATATDRLMSTLPEEMQSEILLKLPAKSILSCKCVCKPWLNLISSPKFIDDHLKLSIQNKNSHKLMFTDKESGTLEPLMYSVDYASLSSSTPDLSCEHIGDKAVRMDTPFVYQEGMEVRILGACNGLMCFSISTDKETNICIWNPTTREYRNIQHCDINSRHPSTAGFGYDSKTRDYKIVIIKDSIKYGCCEVKVYTVRSHLSETIHTFHYKFPILVAFCGVFLKGSLHWIGNAFRQDCVSYDIRNEKLGDVPLPESSLIHREEHTMQWCKLGVLEDCLSIVLTSNKLLRAEVWVMQDYGVRESWTKLFTTTQETIAFNFAWTTMLSLKNGEILLYTLGGFVLCDPKNERIGKVSRFFQKNTFLVRLEAMMTAHPVSYVESLVSLNSGTYVKKPKGQ